MENFWAYLSVTALMVTGVLMIFIILLQRGRGGGLAGAFGGAGGQSALGTKAGDVFTRITIGMAVFWVLLACVSIYALRAGAESRLSNLPSAATEERLEPADAPPDNAGGGSAESNAGTTGGAAGAGSPTSDAAQDDAAAAPPSGDTTP